LRQARPGTASSEPYSAQTQEDGQLQSRDHVIAVAAFKVEDEDVVQDITEEGKTSMSFIAMLGSNLNITVVVLYNP
jgi:hypothetical protein